MNRCRTDSDGVAGDVNNDDDDDDGDEDSHVLTLGFDTVTDDNNDDDYRWRELPQVSFLSR